MKRYIGEKPAYFNGVLVEPGEIIDTEIDHPLLEEVKE